LYKAQLYKPDHTLHNSIWTAEPCKAHPNISAFNRRRRFVITLHLVSIQVLLKVMCHITEGICQALDASLADKCAAANNAEASSSQHQAVAARLVQQCTEVLGIAPEQLFPGWVQRLEGQVRSSYEQRLKAADRKAVMAQVTTQPLFVQITIWDSCHLLL
jgi:hypothetical protein